MQLQLWFRRCSVSWGQKKCIHTTETANLRVSYSIHFFEALRLIYEFSWKKTSYKWLIASSHVALNRWRCCWIELSITQHILIRTKMLMLNSISDSFVQMWDFQNCFWIFMWWHRHRTNHSYQLSIPLRFVSMPCFEPGSAQATTGCSWYHWAIPRLWSSQ